MNADAVAAALDLDLDDVSICLACLSFVSMAIDKDDERETRHWTITMTPDLWDEGLALPARLAVARAARSGVAGAAEALDELEQRGPRSRIARAIVRRLGAQLSERAKGDLLKMGFEPFPPRS
jgi:hypothetical protein